MKTYPQLTVRNFLSSNNEHAERITKKLRRSNLLYSMIFTTQKISSQEI